MCDSNLSSSIESQNDYKCSGNQYYSQKFIEELKEFIPHLQLAEFTGGDPFMIEEYYQIWDLINVINPKCHILITTNANTMNPRIEKMLETHKNIHFNVSIDSLEKGNYEKIRKGGKFELALQNLDKFIDYTKKQKTNLNILVCPMTVNKNELNKFIDFANEKGICVFYHTVVKPKELSLKYTNKTELQQTILQMEQYKFPKRTQNQKTNAQNFQNLVLLLKNWQKETFVSTDDQQELLSESELTDLILKKITNHKHLESKLLVLLGKIEEQDRSKMILNKLAYTNNEIFIEYLESKDIDELTNICLNFK
jgi:molybdenum cofactor biosynthesis enzyme MoaA